MSSVDVSKQLAMLPPGRLEAVQGLLTGWLSASDPNTALPISSETAQMVVNNWLLQVLPDRFTALEPQLIAGGDIWSVSVGLVYPQTGVLAEVGEVLISAFSRGIISATQPEVMKSVGMSHYQEQENAVKAAFVSTRNS